MKHCNYIWLAIVSASLATTTSCQKTQTASAQQTAATLGEGQAAPVAGDATVPPGTAAVAPPAPVTGPAVAPPAVKPDGGRNRFGFGGDGNAVKPLRRENQATDASKILKDQATEIKKDVAQAPQQIGNKIKTPPAPPASSGSSPTVVDVGFASFVPNDNLHVKLPGEYASLGPVSVERIDGQGKSLGTSWPRGTQMQVPNPNVPGGKIYFKVP